MRLLTAPVHYLVVRYLRRRAIERMHEAFDLAARRDAEGAAERYAASRALWLCVEVLSRPGEGALEGSAEGPALAVGRGGAGGGVA